MALKSYELKDQLTRPDPKVRLYVFAGPDEAGSRKLMATRVAALGDGAECVDLSPAQLKDDPARLGDEAAALSLFGGGPRWIRVHLTSGGGDDLVAAATALLELPAAEHPVMVVGGGLTAKSALVKLADAHPAALAIISFVPEGGNARRALDDVARDCGVRLGSGVAQALIAASRGDRDVMARELEKVALYLGDGGEVTLADWEAIGAETPGAAGDALVDAVMGGEVKRLPAALAAADATGELGIGLLRALGRRAMLLAEARVAVERGADPERAVRDIRLPPAMKRGLERQIGRWDAASLARLVERVLDTEHAMKADSRLAELTLRAELTEIARTAARRR